MTVDHRRRRLLALPGLGLAGLLPLATAARPAPAVNAARSPSIAGQTSHLPFGRVDPPQPVPDLAVRLDDGRPVRLRSWMTGHVTVLQLMFTGCSATCPIQGAVFAEVARRLPHRDVRLLSFSIDGLGDSPAALRAWIDRHGAHPAWRAVVPTPQDADRMLGFVRGGAGGPDPHTAKVYFFDRRARLVYKTGDLPAVRDILSVAAEAARAG